METFTIENFALNKYQLTMVVSCEHPYLSLSEAVLVSLPLPHADSVVGPVVHAGEQRAAVRARERHARHCALHVARAYHRQGR